MSPRLARRGAGAIFVAAILGGCSQSTLGGSSQSSSSGEAAATTGGSGGQTSLLGSSGGSTGRGSSSGGTTSGSASSGSSQAGTSGGSGSAGSSSSGGSSSGSCPPNGATEFQPCGSACQCGAPLECVADSQLGVNLCEQPCQSLSDCASLYAACNGTTCGPVPCGPQFDGGFDAACAFNGTAQGSCLPFGPSFGFAFNWEAVGLCSQGGTAALGQPCSASPTRSVDAGLICVAGAVCGPSDTAASGAANFCGPMCNPTLTDLCTGDAGGCLALDVQAPQLGFCDPTGDAGAEWCRPVGDNCSEYTDCCSLNCDLGSCLP